MRHWRAGQCGHRRGTARGIFRHHFAAAPQVERAPPRIAKQGVAAIGAVGVAFDIRVEAVVAEERLDLGAHRRDLRLDRGDPVERLRIVETGLGKAGVEEAGRLLELDRLAPGHDVERLRKARRALPVVDAGVAQRLLEMRLEPPSRRFDRRRGDAQPVDDHRGHAGGVGLQRHAEKAYCAAIVAAGLDPFALREQREHVARVGDQRLVERGFLGGAIVLTGAGLRQHEPGADVVLGRGGGRLERNARRHEVAALERRKSLIESRAGHGHRHNAIAIGRNRRDTIRRHRSGPFPDRLTLAYGRFMPVPRFDLIADRRAIIDRRALSDRLASLPAAGALPAATTLLRDALAAGRAEVARRLDEAPSRGRSAAAATAFLHDQLLRLAFDFVTTRLYPNPNPSTSERVALIGLGGSGRGEMAPYSDVDLMLLVGDRRAPWCEQVAESLLYLLWDLKLKIGQSMRTIDEVVAQSRADMTVRTAMLEARWIWGDEALASDAIRRFRSEVVTGSARDYVKAKLAERDARHHRMGDSRYVVEPNVKDGKGALRDLHTLYWIGQYAFGVERPADLVDKGLFTAAEFRRFERAERFFWAVRCHLHLAAGRAEERLGFDMQRTIAAAMRYADRPGKSAVERFMQFYFLNAKVVGDLTGLFLAQLDEQLADKDRRFALPKFKRHPGRLDGFALDRGRLTIPRDDWFADEPTRLVKMFALAARDGLEIHPAAMRAAARDARLADQVRDDPAANAFFLDVLTNKERPDTVLRWMNEAGVFGRFVPDFGRVVAQMQFDMYHHYTVDEHSIRAIGLTAAIERGELAEDHPLSTALFKQIASRRTLYVAVLLHDIAKGRGGDHSELGADIALELCPRLGLDAAETETVAWLVRHHLLFSHTAFRRDIADPKTINDFVRAVQSPERLRLLLMLTVVDIRAVGPGTWTEWKRQLLRALFDAAEERLRLGHKQRGRSDKVSDRHAALAAELGWSRAAARAHARRLPDSYWLAEPPEWQLANARQIAVAEARIGPAIASVHAEPDPGSGATRLSVFAPDAPGLFYRIATGLAAAGASVVDARIHTTGDAMAMDNLLVTDARGQAYADPRHRARLVEAVLGALGGDEPEPPPALPLSTREQVFTVAPSVLIADHASTRTTVVEVNARDRPGLLARLAFAIHDSGHEVHSAHIATYGERAVDVLYVTTAAGKKLGPDATAKLRAALIHAVTQ